MLMNTEAIMVKETSATDITFYKIFLTFQVIGCFLVMCKCSIVNK